MKLLLISAAAMAAGLAATACTSSGATERGALSGAILGGAAGAIIGHNSLLGPQPGWRSELRHQPRPQWRRADLRSLRRPVLLCRSPQRPDLLGQWRISRLIRELPYNLQERCASGAPAALIGEPERHPFILPVGARITDA